MSLEALEYLQRDEWTAGNGQCHVCWGVSRKWVPDFRYTSESMTGHREGCALAVAIRSIGGETYFIGELSDDTSLWDSSSDKVWYEAEAERMYESIKDSEEWKALWDAFAEAAAESEETT